ncbi:MAG: nucleotide exchange factor GrpE [Actinomycetota bacterium]|nr:nucleotide exchange factor GrpE [Actinomycetota bacterium]MDA3020964.1 nucleotide exchange factor GrpE [Actinomycetota bacterium]
MTNESDDVVVEPTTEIEDAVAVEEAEATIEHDVEALLIERDSFREMAQRLQAEFENYRKRVAAQTTDDINRATGRIAESLLPVLDACEAAFIAHPAEIEPLFNLLLTELKKQGLEALDLSGQTFDPGKADAVIHEEGEGDGSGNPVVSDVLRTGYTWKGRVLRPAMVKVRG